VAIVLFLGGWLFLGLYWLVVWVLRTVRRAEAGRRGPTETVGISVNMPSVLREVYEFPVDAAMEIDGGL
jgi:hypothetical protein